MKAKSIHLQTPFRKGWRIFVVALLCAVAVTACKNDDDDPVVPVSLTPATVSLLTDAQQEVTISGGEAPYTVSANTNATAVKAEISGSKLTLTGLTEGTADVTVSGTDGSAAKVAVAVTNEPAELISIADLKAKLASGESVELSKAIKIKGIVISDADGKNIDAKTAVLQEASDKGGIILQFAANHSLKAGDEAEVTVSKLTLAKVDGELTVKDIPVANAVKTGTGIITPKATTAVNVIANAATLDGTLVTLGAGNFAGGDGKYTGTLQYSDETGSVSSVVADGAAFINTSYPALTTGLTGIVRVKGTEVQVNLRKADDAVSKEGYIMVEDFSGADVGYYSFSSSSLNFQYLYANYPKAPVTDFAEQHPNFGGGTPWNFGARLGGRSINYYGPIPSNSPDADFVNTGRNYLQATPLFATASQTVGDYRGFSLYFIFTESFLQKAKSVTIVFAASKDAPAYTELVNGGMIKSLEWNDSYTTAYKAELSLGTPGSTIGYEIIGESAVFTDQGVWHTVTFDNIDQKYAEVSGNISNLSTYRTHAALYITPGAPSMGEEGLKAFDRGTLTAESRYPDNPNYPPVPYNVGVPIIIDKIIVEFSEKPSWW